MTRVNKAMKYFSVTVACLLLCGCVSSRIISSSDHDDIAEAVLRHMFRPEPFEREVSHAVNQIHKVYFVAFADSADPSPEFIKRFDDLKLPVKPLSTGEWRRMFIYDKATGERGAAFYIEKITMHGRRTAEVKAALHPGGGLSASGLVYRVVQKNGKWVVIGERLKWIS